ncbi:pre-mRNA-splicing factor CWC25 [Blastomyces dermatitidis ER-3]|uniref:Pre-mRNA-splicing factor CWC25 n=3 Tax=Blastomyces TaxID=229219 RepID=A0A179USG7_BLAGS|nr:pre-mRNA-splicing factor CWC25 [Blastomyces gilchristii SLH14081]XP_045277439.1 pre-mRNA-splicing factor CWC25 [Blastomyces dermatitidis ER-3]EEQ90765.1 pre-mRNA-splicing factor CWC25 [Blastomyces dermatitidis ER-3]EGE78897.1 pre-mRNA-splicing factor CWC25 [Blastomyces dermatitidis ATCC 18188]OAT10974.1 pre-mRNA-splicing factor CWC25 [Blastomyces gilchristii SLH14081]
MGGDLNLKKSWHPVLQKNQERVWLEQKKALEERKRIEQMMKERQEERQIQELQEMQEAAGGKKRLSRVDWMYSGPAAGQTGTTEEMEGYLLGKRRIDDLIKGSENSKLQKSSTEDSFMALQNANTARDTAAKIREDPMLAIKKQEQAAYEAMMNDPVRRKQLLKAAGVDTTQSSAKSRKHRKHRHRDDEKEERSSRHRSRRNDDKSDKHRSRRHDEEDDRRSRHRRHRSRSPVRSPSRSRSPPPRYHRSRRSSSPYQRRQSYSPRPRGRSRERSPYQPGEKSPRSKRQSWHHSRRKSPPPPPRYRADAAPSMDGRPATTATTSTNDEERMARLAAMQQSANELDQARATRLAAAEEREREEREAEEAARVQSSKYGGKGRFVSGLNRRAGEIDLADRLRRGRRNIEKEQEAF